MGKLEKLGALWLKTSKNGTEFMSGVIGEQRIVVFRVRDKKNERGPDWEIFKSEPKPEDPFGGR